MHEIIYDDPNYSGWCIACECPARANEIRAIVCSDPEAYDAEESHGHPTVFRTYEGALRATQAGKPAPYGVLV